MAKMRVHELAKELEIKSADIIDALVEKGMDVKAQSSIDEEQIAYIKKKFSSKKSEEVKEEKNTEEKKEKKEEKAKPRVLITSKGIVRTGERRSHGDGERRRRRHSSDGEHRRRSKHSSEVKETAKPQDSQTNVTHQEEKISTKSQEEKAPVVSQEVKAEPVKEEVKVPVKEVVKEIPQDTQKDVSVKKEKTENQAEVKPGERENK